MGNALVVQMFLVVNGLLVFILNILGFYHFSLQLYPKGYLEVSFPFFLLSFDMVYWEMVEQKALEVYKAIQVNFVISPLASFRRNLLQITDGLDDPMFSSSLTHSFSFPSLAHSK